MSGQIHEPRPTWPREVRPAVAGRQRHQQVRQRRLPVDGIPPFFVSQKSVVKFRTTAMDIATPILGCLLSKWHLVTRLLGLGRIARLLTAENRRTDDGPNDATVKANKSPIGVNDI